MSAMKFLKKWISGKKDPNGFRLAYSKEDKTWHVMKGFEIVYIGEKDKCQRYLNHMRLMHA